jgi:ribosomal protein S18 acetylase RimI-like enzyme
MNYHIRLANREDAILIADMSRQTFYDTFAAANTKADMDLFLKEQFTRGKLMLEVGKPDLTFMIAYDGELPVGYVKLRDGKKPEGIEQQSALEIARLYSVTSMIGKGVGKLLMEKSIEVARAMQKEVVWLGVWEKNQRAIDFYHRFGFEKFSQCNFLLGNDLQRDWLMKKEL